MKTKHGFTQFNVTEFETYLKNTRVARTILFIQQHHTYSPDYHLCTTTNQLDLQKSMRDYHVNTNGWKDIGQHFSIFPDGSVVSGRSLEDTPAGIYGFNANAICIENVGNFDIGKDVMTAQQQDAIVKITALLCQKFNIPIDTNRIVYHHWYNLATGFRNNGTGNNKSCPGTAFFGGNKVSDCETHFLPLIQTMINTFTASSNVVNVLEYRIVTTGSLNIRISPSSSAAKATDRQPLSLGAVLRVYEEQNGWYRISSSASHWVYGNYTAKVTRATVNVSTLNVRDGAGTQYQKVGSLTQGEEVFISVESNGWSKIGLDMKWVKSEFLTKSS